MIQKLIAIIALGLAFTGCSHDAVVVEEPTKQPEVAPAIPALPVYAWGYEGDKGVEAWGGLSPDNALCSQGKKQSPINLTWKKPGKQAARLDFSYTTTHAVADVSTPVPSLKFHGANQLLLNGKVFNLDRIEFHSPSEHQLSKNTMSMELQFIHKAVSGESMAALSLFVIEGRENALLNDVWNQFAQGSTQGLQVDASLLIPPQKTHYSYAGSLTSPPCSEGVDWVVFNTPTEASKEQIMAFRSKFAANSRPTQPLNGRKVTNH